MITLNHVISAQKPLTDAVCQSLWMISRLFLFVKKSGASKCARMVADRSGEDGAL